MDLITRAEWGSKALASDYLRPPVNLVILHHSSTPSTPCGASKETERAVVRSIEQHHMKVRGWQTIGYNFLVFQSGRIYEGRGWTKQGAHTTGKNNESIGICLVINAETHHPTPAAIEAVQEIVARGVERGYLKKHPLIKGHRDFAKTECPGKLIYSILEEFR